MRVSFLALGAGLVLASMPVASDAQRADNDILPQSIALQAEGQKAQEAGDLNLAVDYYESALAADPRNRSAIIALAQVARAQGLPGKAIGLYREALLLEPNDIIALTGQGEALADKGALELAREKLATAQRLCAQKCPQVAALERSINASAEKRVVAAEAIAPKVVVSSAQKN
ncbi:tetratricopeptide repeat protein [Sphingopyxis sp. DHUNG17]|uniref:tetratricopeptide repeat protein n=1 Tax=Sphingopyxis jiangsuensis TaxID=2871171 RepID=UPI00191CB505|nr:tetratricopeptide repeat protein [Sphingopyxis lutea]MBL0767250.1 tetratricopeptide repeat protein [Sphingopyxis lutea]